MNNLVIHCLKVMLILLCTCTIYSCGSQKDTASSRGMQNLTARYNYIYNAKLILANYQLDLTETTADNYDQVLPVYIAPETDFSQPVTSLNIKPMEDIIRKAQVIVQEKSYSNYIDEAYILLGKANFFNASYFNAAEYFDYTAKTYTNISDSYLEALNWKARSLMQTRRMSEANKVLDALEELMPNIKKKKILAEPLATLAQMCIFLKNDTAAISYLKDAINFSSESQDRIRWTYILAQLYEKQQNYTAAAANYRKVQKSNAPFEMYFNAKLGQIRIKTLTGQITGNKQDQLRSLLKDDKNFDYIDQVYYQIAESYQNEENYREAETYYFRSVQSANTNLYQKGLSYLRIADLNFKHFRDYLKAKAYYDSTVTTLPKNYPDYDLILKKSQNLQYLTSRYELIALQDTLQLIAKLPESDRAAKIQEFTTPAIQVQAGTTTNPNYQPAANTQATADRSQQTQSSFYFSNTSAVSMGFNDFKRKWGNRKLENNWRQSIRSSSQETTQDVTAITNNPGPVNPDDPTIAAATKDPGGLAQEYNKALPVTPELLNRSNQKIIDAYYEIASFYLQELNDPKEAETVYQILLSRFPANNHCAAIYYSLFLINNNTNITKAQEYKNKVLNDFPASTYARTILDPGFSLKRSELETSVNKQYNEVFKHYEQKEFNRVIQKIGKANNDNNYLSPQFSYLKAIAIGRTQRVDSLINAFQEIIDRFPEDKVITPLVKMHLAYIELHLAEFRTRSVALADFDPNEPPFSTPQITIKAPETSTTQPEDIKTVATEPLREAEPVKVLPKEPLNTTPFSTAKSNTYYYVIQVADASQSLSSSRFGVGQFNRGNYAGSNLKHQLKEFDNEQLIYVGNFSSFEAAKTYSDGITPQLKQIMKVPVNIYTHFIISKENFDMLNNTALLNAYMEFFKINY